LISLDNRLISATHDPQGGSRFVDRHRWKSLWQSMVRPEAGNPAAVDRPAPVVIRRQVSGRPRGVPHLEIVCDKSGFSVGNLVGGHTAVFAHASVRIDRAAATAVIAGLRRRMDGGPTGRAQGRRFAAPSTSRARP
jgi:hypothetical protein